MAPPANEGHGSLASIRFANPRPSNFFFSRHAGALIDQALVSGVSFSTTVLIARWGGIGELGIYSVVLATLLTLFSIHNAVVLVPYSIQHHNPVGTADEHAGSLLIFSIVLGGSLALIGSVLGFCILIVTDEQNAIMPVFALAVAIPFTLLREFARFHVLAHLKVKRVLLLDILFAISQIGGLFLLGYSGRMNATTAISLLAFASAFVFLVWICLTRRNLKFNLKRLRETRERTWSLGGWLLVNQVLMQVQRYAPSWLLIALAGPELTGIYAACLSIVAFSNPVVFGLGNVLTPRAMEALKSGGPSALRAQAVQDGVLLAIVTAIFFMFVVVAGEPILHLVYSGLNAESANHALVILAGASVTSAIGMPAANGLACIQQPQLVVTTGLASAAVTVLLAALLLPLFGLVGVAYGLLIGTSVATIGWWTTLIKLCAAQLNSIA